MSEGPRELVVAVAREEHIVEPVAWGHPSVVLRSEEQRCFMFHEGKDPPPPTWGVQADGRIVTAEACGSGCISRLVLSDRQSPFFRNPQGLRGEPAWLLHPSSPRGSLPHRLLGELEGTSAPGGGEPGSPFALLL